MSKRLRLGENLLRFILDVNTTQRQVKCVLENASIKHLEIISEIFYNIVRNTEYMSFPLQTTISRRGRFLKKFIEIAKKSNKAPQRRLVKKNWKNIYKLLSTFKKVIYQFL